MQFIHVSASSNLCTIQLKKVYGCIAIRDIITEQCAQVEARHRHAADDSKSTTKLPAAVVLARVYMPELETSICSLKSTAADAPKKGGSTLTNTCTVWACFANAESTRNVLNGLISCKQTSDVTSLCNGAQTVLERSLQYTLKEEYDRNVMPQFNSIS